MREVRWERMFPDELEAAFDLFSKIAKKLPKSPASPTD